MLQASGSSAEAGAFKPVCPVCRYDLVASPDGPCPECGNPFTLGGLRAAHEARPRLRRRAAVHAALWTLGWFAATFGLESTYRTEHPEAAILTWLCASLIWTIRKGIARHPSLAFLGSFVPLTAICLLISSNAPESVEAWHRLCGTLVTACTALALARASIPGGRPLAIACVCSGGVAALGCAMLATSMQGWHDGHIWSAWRDLRTWGPYPQYPFKNTEAVAVGASLVVAAALLPFAVKLCRRSAQRG